MVTASEASNRDSDIASLRSAAIREELLACWGRQACRHAEQWPDTLKRLFSKQGNGAEGSRGSYKPAVDEAVEILTRLMNEGTPITVNAVWRAFSKLDTKYCIELMKALNDLPAQEVT